MSKETIKAFIKGNSDLRGRITRMFLILFIIVQAGVTLATYTSSKYTVSEQINSQLDDTVLSSERIIESRISQLRQQADLLSKDFGFREAVASEDLLTIESALANLQSRANVDMALMLDLDGAVLSAADKGGSYPQYYDILSLRDDSGAEHRNQFVMGKDFLYEIVIVPIKAPITVGWIALGQALDDASAKAIRNLSSQTVDVGFLFKQADTWTLSGSTQTDGFLDYYLTSKQSETTEPNLFRDIDVHHQGETIAVRFVPFPGQQDKSKMGLILYTSRDKAMESYQNMFFALGGLSLLGVFILYSGSRVLARSVSAPFTELLSATEKMAEGHYSELPKSSDLREVNRLISSFNSMSTAIQNRENHIIYQGQHDSDTNLPNRKYMESQLTAFASSEKNIALVIAEIQKFHALRNLLEHPSIIDLVQQVGDRLQSLTGCEVARLSTDSFGFVITDGSIAETLLPGIEKAFLEPFTTQELTVDIKLIMGVSDFESADKVTDQMIINAYAAIDQARAEKISFARFNPENATIQQQHLSLMSDLREDMQNGHVTFAYQPKLDLKTGKIKGAEALMRWISPKHGFVSPEVFIPLAEEMGDIQLLTDWALRTIIKQTAEWAHKGHDLLISANLSGQDLQNEKLPAFVRGLMEEFDLSARHLCLEVTESAVMGDMDRACNILQELDDMGIFLSIDDYGTGFSSLSYLKRLPVGELKIDKSFVLKLASDDADAILVNSTIDLAHNLGMKATAEGVEDETSLDMLKRYGCDTIQGYHIARPMPVDEFIAFVEAYP